MFTSKKLILVVLITLACLIGAIFIKGLFSKSHPEAPETAAHDKAAESHQAQDQKNKSGHTTALPVVKKKPSDHFGVKTPSHAPQASKNKQQPLDEKPHVAVPTHAPAHAVAGGKGYAFVEACIKPMNRELNERFWGWRPNDALNFTDNVNNFQLGVLEVTRRATVALAENISRTSSTDAYVPALEFAMNWFMIKPTKYWFPSAEAKYQEGLDELENYLKMLKTGEARFYSRIDNLVPLLKAFESILGSCDENLVKDLGEMSSFKSDDYVYYTRGVASAMATILEAVAIDFGGTVTSVQGDDVLHHAITALHHAGHMSPWLVMEGSPDGFLANHRANMAAPISHAKVYLGILKTALTGNIQ